VPVDPKIIEALESIVGPEYVTTDEVILASYVSKGIMGLEAQRADIVVRPKYVEEVRRILMLANEHKIPVTPVAGGLSGGYACPTVKPGGILLDLSRMNRILEVDTDARYVVVEPGVRCGQIWRFFRDNYPEWAPPIPDGAPPAATVLGDALERGFSLVTSKYGPQADLVLGLEVVLPTGDILRTGSWALPGAKPFYRWGLGPDFTGLFLGSQGTLGVVTKMAIKIVPHPEHKDIVALAFEDPETMQKVTLRILKKEVGVMVQGGNWWLVPTRMDHESKLPHDYEFWKKRGVPKYFMNFEIWGITKEHLELEKKIIDEEVKAAKSKGEVVDYWKLHPRQVASRLKKPNKIAIPYAKWRGAFLFITWYLPWKGLAEFMKICEQKMEEYGFAPVIWVASIEHGRECIGMPIVCFNNRDPDDIQRVIEFNRETTEIFLDKGWINYRPDAKIHAPAMYSRAQGYYYWLKKIKQLFDPNGIMHPGRLCL